MNSVDGIFMSITAALEPNSKSFEEVRIEDYIKAYQATGRPPVPCPQEPSDETQRKLLNLPPLFKPYTPSLTAADSTTVGEAAKPGILSPSDLPRAQEFRIYSNAGEKYHCISSSPEFSNFSQEELRYYAYIAGNKQSPIPITMHPFVQTVKEVIPPLTAHAAEEKLQSVVAQPGYEKHSPEEFRIAYLLYRRELTSAELIQLQNPSASIPAAVIAPPPPATPVVASTPSIPLPIFASTTPSLPKFTFGFK